MNFCSAESSAPMRTTNYEQAAATQGSLRIPSLVFGRRNRTVAAAGNELLLPLDLSLEIKYIFCVL